MKTYTQTKAAEMLNITRQTLQDRMSAIARSGDPLSVEAGELVCLGKNHRLTAKGVAKIRRFTPQHARDRKDTLPDDALSLAALREVCRRKAFCREHGYPIDPDLTPENVRRTL